MIALLAGFSLLLNFHEETRQDKKKEKERRKRKKE